ncbi:hypothetical protein STFE110948_05415 [Streptobacillus felis]
MLVKILRKIILVLILLGIAYCYSTNKIYDSATTNVVVEK